jgi:hypothetical protein
LVVVVDENTPTGLTCGEISEKPKKTGERKETSGCFGEARTFSAA